MSRQVSRHRAAPPPRYQPRYGRLAVLGVSLTTTAIALLGGVGVLPSAADDEPDTPDAVVAADLGNPRVETVDQPRTDRQEGPSAAPDTKTEKPSEPAEETESEPEQPAEETESEPEQPAEETEPVEETAALPADSGEGKRVVFSETEQRVWLVGEAGEVKRTYLVSGSLTDNLDPGTYQVYSRSEDAIGIDDSGTMKWFVRFTQGPTGAAIGFHTIPIDEGERVQKKWQLGTPQSHGCIRQDTPDAKALWAFAPLGTTVVVV